MAHSLSTPDLEQSLVPALVVFWEPGLLLAGLLKAPLVGLLKAPLLVEPPKE